MERLDQNLLRQLRADPQPHIAYLADNIGVLGQKTDFLLFAEAHFPKPMGYFRWRIKLLYSYRSACANVT